MKENRTEFITQLEQTLIEKGWLLCTAESCTGGLIANWLTDISGSSACYVGGVAAYANEAKLALLGVTANTIQAHGAVSGPVALEMAQGIRARFAEHFDAEKLIGISTTGIAGPTGGTEEKPVGLVYIGISTPQGSHVERFVWKFDGSSADDRIRNKEASALQALRMVETFLQS
ncbi:MAG: CinA family protein [Anaerolineae bacterium]|jgi:PncC family amidohydrolase|nr:CinA family protein [Anaerolineae bacterium]